MLLLVVGVTLVPGVANAVSLVEFLQCISDPQLCGLSIGGGLVFDLFAQSLGEFILRIMSWVVYAAGIILNMSIVLTLNIKALYEATPAIEQTWLVIRNISSIFIIFALLYASINTILGTSGPQIKSLILKVFVAGVLINFSLFFTKVLIDASNLVSIQFYRAIAPNSQNVEISGKDIGTVLYKSFTDGGISDIFMQSLKIQKIYNPTNKTGILTKTNSAFLIAVSTLGGSIIMLIAALSFFAAALAFIARIAILLLIMGFSPLYFVGLIFPQIGSVANEKLVKPFINQLTFMPVYLLLTYVALRFISDDGFFNILTVATQNSTAGVNSGTSSYLLADVGLIFQFILAIIFINIPIIAAIQLGGKMPKWAGGIKDIAGNIFKRGGSAVGRNTYGVVASKISNSGALKDFASRSKLGALALKGTRGVASDYNKNVERKAAEREAFGRSLGFDQQAVNTHQVGIDNIRNQLFHANVAYKANPTAATRADVDALEQQIDVAEQALSNTKESRVSSYIDRTRDRSIRSGFSGLARGNQIAAASLQIPILENQMKRHKEELSDVRKDLNELAGDVKKNAGPASGIPTPAQTALKNSLVNREGVIVAQVRAVQDNINHQKSII